MTPSTEPERPVNVRTAEMFDRLRELDYACGPTANKNDRVIALISGCIAEGVNTRSSIIRVISSLGFHRGHVAKFIDMHCGNNPNLHWWHRDDAEIYHLLAGAPA